MSYPDLVKAERIQRRLRISFDLADRLTVADDTLRKLVDDLDAPINPDVRWSIRMFLRLTAEATLNESPENG